jgi:hypothetical protein
MPVSEPCLLKTAIDNCQMRYPHRSPHLACDAAMVPLACSTRLSAMQSSQLIPVCTRWSGRELHSGSLAKTVGSRDKSRPAYWNLSMWVLSKKAGECTSVFKKKEWRSPHKQGQNRGAWFQRSGRFRPLDGFSCIEFELENNNWQKGTEIGR